MPDSNNPFENPKNNVVSIDSGRRKRITPEFLDMPAAEYYFDLGLDFENKKEFKEAMGAYKKALEFESSYALAWFNLANLYDSLGDTKQAIESYKKALECDSTYADAFYNLALLQRNSDPFSALSNFQKYLKHSFVEDRSFRALAYQEIGRLRKKLVVEPPAS